MYWTDELWTVVKPLIPDSSMRENAKGQPWVDHRRILDGILWVMRTSTHWKDLPERCHSCQTCHRRFKEYIRADIFGDILIDLVKDIMGRGDLALT